MVNKVDFFFEGKYLMYIYSVTANLYRVTLVISNSSESILHKGEIGIFYISVNGNRGNTNFTKIFGYVKLFAILNKFLLSGNFHIISII